MTMKGMSQTLYLVVAAIVILVTAVIIIAVFLQGVTPAMGLAESKSLCQTTYSTSCLSFGQEPPTWNVQNMKVTKPDGPPATLSCREIMASEGLTCNCNDRVPECSGSGSSSNAPGTTTVA